MENTSIRLGLTDFLKALLIPSSDHRLSATRGHTLDSEEEEEYVGCG